MQRVPDKLIAVLEQIRAKLAARAGKTVQVIEIELAGELTGNTVQLMWLAIIRRGVNTPCCGSGSRITAQGG